MQVKVNWSKLQGLFFRIPLGTGHSFPVGIGGAFLHQGLLTCFRR